MPGRHLAAAAGAAVAALVLSAMGAMAATPPPDRAFHLPQYLVFMEGHQTYDGPVIDNAYWLYPYVPDDGTSFVVPDGSGGVYHYTGRVVAGPFATVAEACPAMLAAGVPSLVAWRTAAGEDSVVADCTSYAATPSGSGSGGTGVGGPGAGGTDAAGGDVEGGLADAMTVVGGILLGVGVAGSAITRRKPRPKPQSQPTDPCAAQAGDVARLSARARYLNGLLQSTRQYVALMQAEIDRLANLILPGSVVLDAGFLAGSLSGGSAAVLSARGFIGGLVEGVLKDVLKDVAKQALANVADPGNVLNEATLSASKTTLLKAIEDGVTNRRFFGELSPSLPKLAFRDVASYKSWEAELEAFGSGVAKPIADGVGAILDIYTGGLDALALKDRLDHARAVRDSILDQQATLEVEFESVLEDERSAHERLEHCRLVNAPGWRP
jgi:hypothetical protein